MRRPARIAVVAIVIGSIGVAALVWIGTRDASREPRERREPGERREPRAPARGSVEAASPRGSETAPRLDAERPSTTQPAKIASIRTLPEVESRLRERLVPIVGEAATIESIECTVESCRVVLQPSDPVAFVSAWERLQDPESGLEDFGSSMLLEGPAAGRYSFRILSGDR